MGAREQYEKWLQQSAYTLSIETFFDTINLSLPQPVEDLSVLPRDVTLNALQQGKRPTLAFTGPMIS